MKKTLLALFVFLSFSINALAAVNINTATQAELESLNGIGPVKAQAIIDYRKKNGNFKSIDELEKVDGVGTVTMQNVRKEVSVSGKTTAVIEEPKTPAAKAISKEKKPVKAATKAVDSEKATKPVKADITKEEMPANADKKISTKKAPKETATKNVSKAKKSSKADMTSATDKKE